jgi:flavodoxin
MPRFLVAYFSLTGNTKMVAEAVYAALDGEKEIGPIDEIRSLEPYDLVFIGFPVVAHSVPYRVGEFLKKIPAGKQIAFFCTHGSLRDGPLSRQAIEHATILASRAKILGVFSCRGRVSLEGLAPLSKSPEHSAWTEMAASAGTHPDASDLAEAGAFAQEMRTLSSLDGY